MAPHVDEAQMALYTVTPWNFADYEKFGPVLSLSLHYNAKKFGPRSKRRVVIQY
jgi:hypothetical protein